MPSEKNRSPARLLAPTALALVALALFAVLASSGTDEGGGGGGDGGESTEARTSKEKATDKPKAKVRSTYTVKTGDTLGEIAQKSDVEVAKLQELNPELDPQALVSGQKIKLRE